MPYTVYINTSGAFKLTTLTRFITTHQRFAFIATINQFARASQPSMLKERIAFFIRPQAKPPRATVPFTTEWADIKTFHVHWWLRKANILQRSLIRPPP